MERLQAADLILLAPELTLIITAVVLTLIDLVMPNKASRTSLGWLSIAGLVIALAFTASRYGAPITELLNGSYRLDDYANLFKTLFLSGAILVTLPIMATAAVTAI